MKYNQPFGSADPNAPYVDRNTPGAISGSRVPAKAVEMPQREIVSVITAAGLPPTNDDPTQLLQAIQWLIAQVTGEGDTEDFVLMTQARNKLPIFPETVASDGLIPVFSPANGTVRIPAGYDFIHRGIFTVTTVQTDLPTSASKTFHVRWTPSGFVIKDLADTGYNPGGALDEANPAFDSKYDDMLLAKVVTNASNVPTVTPLANKNVLAKSERIQKLGSTPWDILSAHNWARTPSNYSLDIIGFSASNGPDYWTINKAAVNTINVDAQLDVNRYRVSQRVIIEAGTAGATFQFNARA